VFKRLQNHAPLPYLSSLLSAETSRLVYLGSLERDGLLPKNTPLS